ncbi:MAG TPA: phosphatidylglycerophosphatase A [candidate division Zixibacteria bacterium]
MPKSIIKILATFFSVGYFPIAPGTLASLVTLVLAWFLLPQETIINLFVCLAIILVAVWSGTKAEEFWGEDNRRIVIDEVAGMLVSIFLVSRSIRLYLAAFLLFRFFDVLKPFPIRKLEKLKSGWGVTTDDIAAGVYANITLLLLLYLRNILKT